MITNYVTIDTIIEELNRIKIPGSYWNPDEIKEWTYKALSFVSSKLSNIKAEDTIDIVDYKGLIPVGVEKLDKVIYVDNSGNELELYYILTTEEINTQNYDINAGYLYISRQTGKVILHYYTVPVDIEDRPLIPDEKYYIQAIVSYIRLQLGTRAYWQGKILERQLLMLEQEWHFYLPAAQNHQKMKIMQDSYRFRKISNRHFL